MKKLNYSLLTLLCATSSLMAGADNNAAPIDANKALEIVETDVQFLDVSKAEDRSKFYDKLTKVNQNFWKAEGDTSDVRKKAIEDYNSGNGADAALFYAFLQVNAPDLFETVKGMDSDARTALLNSYLDVDQTKNPAEFVTIYLGK